EGADFEGEALGAGSPFGGQLLPLEIDDDLNVPLLFKSKEPLEIGLGKLDGQHPAVEHVLAEDAGIALGDDGMDIVDLENPGGMLPGRSATEVLARNDDPGPAEFLSIGVKPLEFEILEAIGLERLFGDFGQVLGRN